MVYNLLTLIVIDSCNNKNIHALKNLLRKTFDWDICAHEKLQKYIFIVGVYFPYC